MNDIPKIAAALGATPADIPGLWNVPGHPELTTGQLRSLWGRTIASPGIRVHDIAIKIVKDSQ